MVKKTTLILDPFDMKEAAERMQLDAYHQSIYSSQGSVNMRQATKFAAMHQPATASKSNHDLTDARVVQNIVDLMHVRTPHSPTSGGTNTGEKATGAADRSSNNRTDRKPLLQPTRNGYAAPTPGASSRPHHPEFN